MGNLRLLRFGAEFSLRTRRIIFFIIFFIALTGVTLYAINEITREDRDLFLSQKSVILEQDSWNSVTADSASTFASENFENAYVMRYITIQSLNMKIFSVDLSLPWSNTIVRPDEIRQGSYITSDLDMGNNTFQALSSSNLVALDVTTFPTAGITNTYSIGSILSFNDSNSDTLNLEMVGLFRKASDLPKDELWIMIPDTTFEAVLAFLDIDLDSANVFAYQVIVSAPGYSETVASILFGSSIPIVERNTQIATDQNVLSGSGFSFKDAPNINNVKSQATSTDVILILGLVGSPVVATLYAFIISRFRTREIAVLKAVGYSNSSVQTMLLSEIGTVSILGFLISVFGFQFLLMLNAQYTLDTTYVPLIWNPLVDLIPSSIAITTFIFVVLSNLLGFIIISRKSISVRPVELFKNAG